MAHLYRLMLALLGVLAAPGAWASFPAGTSTVWAAYSASSFGFYSTPAGTGYATKLDATLAFCARSPATYNGGYVGVVSGVDRIVCTKIAGSYDVLQGFDSAVVTAACPAHSTGTSTCTCSAGWAQPGGTGASCYDTNWLAAIINAENANNEPRRWINSTSLSSSYCDSSGFIFSGMMAVQADPTHVVVYGPFRSEGLSCTPGVEAASMAPALQTAADAAGCKGAEQAGTVNGVSVCLPPLSSNNGIVSGPSVAASGAAGSSSNPMSQIPNAPPTATGASTSTSCVSQTCTTTTTFTNSSGTVVGTSSKSAPQSGFCTEGNNAKLPLCQASSFGGKCGAPNVCSGDAIQCAIAAESVKTTCAVQGSAAEQAVYAAAKVLTGNQITALPGNTTTAIGSGSFDRTELLGTAHGMDDLSTTVAGNSVTLEFSQVNVWLERLGYLLVAVTFLICLRIVSSAGHVG